jgi:hypothetical protein
MDVKSIDVHAHAHALSNQVNGFSALLRYLYVIEPKGKKAPERKENETGHLVEELRLLNTEWKG